MVVGARTCVLLPIVAPGSVDGLVALALDVAGPDGTVRALTAVPEQAGRDRRREARATLRRVEQAVAERVGDRSGIELDTEVLEADHPALAIHDATSRHDVDVVVMGWRGSGSATSSFGAIIDEVVGRSRVPLLMLRAGTRPPTSLVVAFDTDQLHPAGRRGLVLAGGAAAALREANGWPVTLLQTGADDLPDLPVEIATLTDRIHHDPRRRHDAVEAVVDPSTMVVAPVAPTVAGLRAATTRLNWATGDASLLVAIDVGPIGPREPLSRLTLDLPAPVPTTEPPGRHGVGLTIVSDEPLPRRRVVDALAVAGEVGSVRTWWSGRDDRPHLSVMVTVTDCTESDAVASVMAVTDSLPELVGARVRYDLVDAPSPLRVRELRPMGPLGELDWE
ncbi:universal stress protein [Salsipaludibacter albus]|uniref:universal stress protein n=1 Tax=Salsipaludibacter albus TaxID=2849650 RepID=UPI001EE43A33|nr:universal stress protein [Salsipaludibacter albus]MBY5163955.1 universal stress protein [Salsipaludibacter albus]